MLGELPDPQHMLRTRPTLQALHSAHYIRPVPGLLHMSCARTTIHTMYPTRRYTCLAFMPTVQTLYFLSCSMHYCGPYNTRQRMQNIQAKTTQNTALSNTCNTYAW
eukprot:scpid60360/ scgid4520/ 